MSPMNKKIISVVTISIVSVTSFLTNDSIHAQTNTPLKYKAQKQLVLGQIDKYGRASSAHIQVSSSQLPKTTRATLTYNPKGWHNYNLYFDKNSTKKSWLFDRGHLVGYQLSGLNNEKRNLTIQTHYLNAGSVNGINVNNINSMLFYENKLTAWIKKYKTYRLDYAVTPKYVGNELVPRTIQLTYVGYTNKGKVVPIALHSSKEKKNTNGTTTVTLANTSFNAKINYLTGTAVGSIKTVPKKTVSSIKTYAGVKIASHSGNGYTIKVVKTAGTVIGYAKPNQTVYVATRGTAKVYWFNTSHMPKNTNKKNVKNFTIQNAVKAKKMLSNTEHN